MTMGWGAVGPAMHGGQDGNAGIPPELLEAANRISSDEPVHERREVAFSHATPEWTRPLTFRALFGTRKGAIAVILLIVGVETVAQQMGPRLTQYGIDRGILRNDFGTVVFAVGLYLASIAVAIVFGASRTAMAGRVGESILYRLRVSVFRHLQRLSLDFFTREKAGVIMTRMTSDVEALQAIFQEGLLAVIVQVLTLVVVTVQLFSMNASLAAIVVLGILPPLVVLTWWFRSASDRGYMAARERIAGVLSDLQENLGGIRIVTAYNRQRHNRIRHRNVVGSYRDANVYTARVAATYGPASETLGILAQAALLVLGGRMILDGRLSIGELTAFVLYLNSFFQPIQQLVQLYNSYQQGRTAMIKLRELFATEPSVAERPGAPDLPPIEGSIVLEGVTFGYDPAVPVLRDLDLSIRAGETIALVGPTGAGKSSIAKLLARFYDPQAGRVTVDGHDLRDVTLASLRRQLGIVPQMGFLFAGTIRDNVAFANPDVSDEEILAACEQAGIRELIERLPRGLDTPCHERGVTLSAGERQLIALARAMVAAPRILILDEATSNLDLSTEAKIEHALDVLLEGRTAILIAHRLNTAQRADRIVVVDHGRIVEVGAHDDLVSRGGVYTRLYEAWSHAAHAGDAA